MKRDLRLFVDDIIENIELIENSTKNLSKTGFKSDKDIIDATIRRLEVIGEAVKNLPNSFVKKYPKVPWKDIAGFRDILIHAYFGINLDRVWNSIKRELSNLKEEIQKVKEELR